MDDTKYKQKLLERWEETYRQGLLTFWVFVALSEKSMTVSELRHAIKELTNGTYATSEAALYRLMRQQYDLETVDMKEMKSPNGPNKKVYSLSTIGKELLNKFIDRNIKLFYQPLVKKKVSK